MGLMWLPGELSRAGSFPSRSSGESRNKELEWCEAKSCEVLPETPRWDLCSVSASFEPTGMREPGIAMGEPLWQDQQCPTSFRGLLE